MVALRNLVIYFLHDRKNYDWWNKGIFTQVQLSWASLEINLTVGQHGVPQLK